MAARLRAVARLIRGHGPLGLALVAWTMLACRRVRRQLARGGLGRYVSPRPTGRHRPAGPAGAGSQRRQLLGDRAGTAALVRRAGVRRTVVIGVSAPAAGFHAHAWLDGDPDPHRHELAEILRHPVPPAWLR
ncbi:hypothetical protein NKG94_45520 [Micromonospora sp. M12]